MTHVNILSTCRRNKILRSSAANTYHSTTVTVTPTASHYPLTSNCNSSNTKLTITTTENN